jgi:hypothetical protein
MRKTGAKKHKGGVLRRVVSGGQTGVDRAALDAAMETGFRTGGFCPKGRLAEDGPIPERYKLTETRTSSYEERTRLNVKESDATLILARGPLTGGTALTADAARVSRRPLLIIDLGDPEPDFEDIEAWLSGNRVRSLNAAGPRESGCPGIYSDARGFLKRLLLFLKNSSGDV